jgi:predicted ATPase
LREVFRRHGGVEVDTQGDAFFVAFTRASDALGAAGEGQRALASGPIRVRMGVHTGEPIATDEGYAGIDVHRAARICAAGHGGQVLVSQTTRDLVANDLLDLGPHRLKDLSDEQRIYQLGEDEHPRLKTLHQTNLPVQPTPLIGRARELETVAALIGEHRLVTFVGPGGTGKTRLALQVAADLVSDFVDGVWWVPLAAVREPSLVIPAVAQALGVRGDPVVAIQGKRMLLLLDNFEQLIDAAAEAAELLAAAPQLHMLVTSRRPLVLHSEQLYEVFPLPESDAVVLFTERARMQDHAFVAAPEVVEICRRLDGLPLAIELAAARSRMLDPERLLVRLEQRLPVLTGGHRDAPERQRTLRATIDWSYDLLESAEQELLALLSIFAGGWTLEAAEDVCDASLDGLQSLHEKSLVRTRGERFFLLETIREYAAERLAERPESNVAERHANYYAALAGDLGPQVQSARQSEAIALLALEQHNFRQALEWVAERPSSLLLKLAGNLGTFWGVTGLLDEGARWTTAALESTIEQPPELRARTLLAATALARVMGRTEISERYARESLDLGRSLGDPQLEGRALLSLANVLALADDLAGALVVYEEASSVTRSAGDDWGLALTLGNLAYLRLEEGDAAGAEELQREAVELHRNVGNRAGMAAEMCNVGLTALRRERLSAAADAFLESLDVSLEIDYKELVVYSVLGCASVVSKRARHREATLLLAAADTLAEQLAIPLQPLERALHDEAAAAAALELTASDHEEAVSQGRVMSLDDLLAYARESTR